MTLLNVKNLTKSYDGKHRALDDVSFSLSQGQFVSLIGSSGAGKSTLLRCINRLVDPSSGSITFDGVDITQLKGRALRQQRRQISMIFQSYNLVMRSTVIQNVLQGRLGYKGTIAGTLGLFDDNDKELALYMLERVGLAEYAYVRADQLSGGQKQRVGIARALVQQPKLLLADEPIASLDLKSSRDVLELIQALSNEFGITCLVSLHQVDYALEFSDYIIGISSGRQCCKGTPQEFTDKVINRIYEDGLLDE